MLDFLLRMKVSDGGFMMHADGESDVRYVVLCKSNLCLNELCLPSTKKKRNILCDSGGISAEHFDTPIGGRDCRVSSEVNLLFSVSPLSSLQYLLSLKHQVSDI